MNNGNAAKAITAESGPSQIKIVRLRPDVVMSFGLKVFTVAILAERQAGRPSSLRGLNKFGVRPLSHVGMACCRSSRRRGLVPT